MKLVTRTVWLALMALSLSACGPRTIASMMFPTRYTVETTVEYSLNGAVLRNVTVSRCKVIDYTDSIRLWGTPEYHVDFDGERNWISLPNRSVIILNRVKDPCRWFERPDIGAAVRLSDAADLHRFLDTSWHVDDGDEPKRIELLNTEELFSSHPGYPQIRSVTWRVIARREPSQGLRQVAPALDRMDRARAAHNERRREDRSLRYPNPEFVRAGAEMTECLSKPSDTHPGEFVWSGCGRRLKDSRNGFLMVDVNEDLTRVTVRDEPVQHVVEDVLFPIAPLLDREDFIRGWEPEICYLGECGHEPRYPNRARFTDQSAAVEVRVTTGPMELPSDLFR